MNVKKKQQADTMKSYLNKEMVVFNNVGKDANYIKEIRKQAEKQNIQVLVIKNTIAEKVLHNWNDQIIQHMTGSNIIFFGDIMKILSLVGRTMKPKLIADKNAVITKDINLVSRMGSKAGVLMTLCGLLQTPIASLVKTLEFVHSTK
jgi:ribosomal protein L10